MKKKLIVPIVAFCMLSMNAFGQTYERIYAESSPAIQAQMDLNKRSGVDILQRIQTSHHVGVSGLTNEQKSNLIDALKSDSKVLDVIVSADLKSLTITSSAWYTKESIQTVLSTKNITLIGYSSNYSIVEEN